MTKSIIFYPSLKEDKTSLKEDKTSLKEDKTYILDFIDKLDIEEAVYYFEHHLLTIGLQDSILKKINIKNNKKYSYILAIASTNSVIQNKIFEQSIVDKNILIYLSKNKHLCDHVANRILDKNFDQSNYNLAKYSHNYRIQNILIDYCLKLNNTHSINYFINCFSENKYLNHCILNKIVDSKHYLCIFKFKYLNTDIIDKLILKFKSNPKDLHYIKALLKYKLNKNHIDFINKYI